MDRLRAHVIIEGRVQGVCFRSSTGDEALALGVTGWVRNNPDGTVEAVFEGGAKDVEAMLKWCGNGPDGARVTDLNISYEEITGEFEEFRIHLGPNSF